MVLAKPRSQEILTPSLNSKPHHHLRLVERRFRPHPSRRAEDQINCHPKTLAALESTQRTAGWLAQVANSDPVRASSSIPARKGFFCEIEHSQHILGSFRGIARVAGFLDGRASLESVWRACSVDAACLLLPLCHCVTTASEGKHMADTNRR